METHNVELPGETKSRPKLCQSAVGRQTTIPAQNDKRVRAMAPVMAGGEWHEGAKGGEGLEGDEEAETEKKKPTRKK